MIERPVDLRQFRAFAEPTLEEAARLKVHMLPPNNLHAITAACWCHPRELGPEAAELFEGDVAVWIHQPFAPRWG